MNSRDAIKSILSNLKSDDIAIFTTGYISRHAFAVNDRRANFYMIGSMGLVSSVGLGIALNTRKKVFIFDGDGSILMDLGTMAMIANHKPWNLFHIVLDNGSYESTGGQPAISGRIDLFKIAKSAGYRTLFKLRSLNGLEMATSKITGAKGPVFVLLKLRPAVDAGRSGRVSIEPSAIASRLRSEVSS